MFLEINNLKKSFGTGESRVEVLKGIQFSVEKGEICVLLGPSGSGKSTLLNIIGGIDEADSGSIVIEGEKIEDMNEKTLTRYRRKHLGYVFQMYNLIPNLTVKENMEVGAYLSDHPLDINDLLKTLGLYDHRNKLPNLPPPTRGPGRPPVRSCTSFRRATATPWAARSPCSSASRA